MKGFIELHDMYDTKLLININNIIDIDKIVCTNYCKTQVNLNGYQSSFLVKETYEEVKQKIEEAMQ